MHVKRNMYILLTATYFSFTKKPSSAVQAIMFIIIFVLETVK